MRISVETTLIYATAQPCDILLQIETGEDAEQACHVHSLSFDAGSVDWEIDGEDGFGRRRWVKAGAHFECLYAAQVDISRAAPDFEALEQTPWSKIPGDVVKYLMPSRYCHSELFLDFVGQTFGELTGGPLILAMRDWVSDNFTYDAAASLPGTTATDSFASLSGVCRDYAHMMIVLSRAAGIPARFVSVYGPDVDPQDFHAVVEVFLSGAWHMIDPTRMTSPDETVKICWGRDAADASFMTSYGRIELIQQSVVVRRDLDTTY